jgi:hypothetical protein
MLIAIFSVQMLFFCSTNDVVLVCSTNILVCRKKKFEHAVQTFATILLPFGVSFCRLKGQVLLPYVKFLKRCAKVCCIFLGGGGVKASLWTACCCQK